MAKGMVVIVDLKDWHVCMKILTTRGGEKAFDLSSAILRTNRIPSVEEAYATAQFGVRWSLVVVSENEVRFEGSAPITMLACRRFSNWRINPLLDPGELGFHHIVYLNP